LRTGVDAAGKHFGAEIWAAYQKPEGEITEVDYVYPKPGGRQGANHSADFWKGKVKKICLNPADCR
jgi:hypothetical protein